MAKEVIRVTIKPDGNMQVAVEGVQGKNCIEATQDLEVFLGKQKGERELTADYYKKPDAPETPWIRRG